jgi:hypothetical protein
MEHLPIQQFQWIGLKHLQETMLACCYPKLLPKIDLFFPAVFPDLILKGLEWRRQPEEVDSYLVYLVGCTGFVGEDCGQFQQETPPTEWFKMVQDGPILSRQNDHVHHVHMLDLLTRFLR